MSSVIKTDQQFVEESRLPYQECEHLFIKKESLTAHQKSEHVGTKYPCENVITRQVKGCTEKNITK